MLYQTLNVPTYVRHNFGRFVETLKSLHTVDCLIPLTDVDFIPFNDDTLEELKYITGLACSDGLETFLHVPTLHIETTSSSSYVVLDHLGIATSLAPINSM